MNKLITLPVLTSAALMSAVVFAAEPGGSMPFTTATFTEVVNDVQLIPAGSTQGAKAAVKTVFNAPDRVKTGRKSRAQLTAADGTIARVGSNAVFAFDKDSRTVNLERGSILFHSPTGKGGGSIVTNSATASVIGTTIIVTATSDGGFKMFVLEGVAKVKFPNGKTVSINPGQMTFVLPGSAVSDGGSKGGEPGPVLNFDLGAMSKDSLLIGGFGSNLPSMGKINTEVNSQNGLIADGDLVRTGLVILGATSSDEFFLTSQDAVQAAIQANNLAISDAQRLADALAGSFTYTGGPLPESFVFRTPVFVDFLGESLTGLLAGHLEINAPGLDLSTFTGLPEVTLLGASASSLVIKQNLNITGLDAGQGLIVAGDSLVITDGVRVNVSFNNLSVETPSSVEFGSLVDPITFNGVTLEAADPGVSLFLGTLGGDMSLTGGALLAGESLELFSSGKLQVSLVSLKGSDATIFASDDIHLSGALVNATSGDLDVVTSAALAVDGSSKLEAPSGALSLFSTGALSVSDSVLKGGALIQLESSASVALANVTAEAVAGDLIVQAGTTLDISGGSFKAPSGAVSLSGGGGDFNLGASPATISARDGVNLSSSANLMVSNLTTIDVTNGSINATAGGSMSLGSMTASATNLSLTALGALDLGSSVLNATSGAVTVAGNGVSAGAATLSGGDLHIDGRGFTVTLSGTTINTGNLNLNGATLTLDTVTLDATGATFIELSPGVLADTITIKNSMLNTHGVDAGGTTAQLRGATIVLDGVTFSSDALPSLRVSTGLITPRFDGTPATEVPGNANLYNVTLGSLDVLSGDLVWAPAQNLGDVSMPVHVLDAKTDDFRGTKQDYAKGRSLFTADFISATGIPNSHVFRSDTPAMLDVTDFGLPAATTIPDITLPDQTVHSALEVKGVLAQNITLGGTTDISLSRFEPINQESPDRVDLVATGSIDVLAGAVVTFRDMLQNRRLELRAGTISLGEGAHLVQGIEYNSDQFADTTTFFIAGVNGLTANGTAGNMVEISNKAGSIDLGSFFGDVTLTNTQVIAGFQDPTVDNSGAFPILLNPNLQEGYLSVTSLGTNAKIQVIGGTLKSYAGFAGNGVSLEAATVLVENVAIRSERVADSTNYYDNTSDSGTVAGQSGFIQRAVGDHTSSGRIEIKGSTLVKLASVSGGQTLLVAEDIDIKVADANSTNTSDFTKDAIELDGVKFVMKFSQYTGGTQASTGIAMEAKTVSLQNIVFPDQVQVRLKSQDGILNIGSRMFGAVNFVQNVGIRTNGSIDTVTDLTTLNGINNNVWVENGANFIRYHGAPITTGSALDGVTGQSSAGSAPIHIQSAGATNLQGRHGNNF